jgi:PKD repeat protein
VKRLLGLLRLSRPPRSRIMSLGSVMMSLALVVAVVAGTVGKKGHSSSKVSLSTGSAWFPSPDVGTAALIDGTTVTREAQVTVAPPGHHLEAVEAGSGAYVLDHSTGEAVRVDGASLTAAAPIRLGTPDDSHLSLRSTGQVTWAVERGGTVAQQLDPQTLVPVGPALAFPGHAAAPVIGTDGTLWLVDGPVLQSLKGSKVRTNVTLGKVGAAQLVMASGHPVVLDSTNHQAIEINPASGRRMRSVCFDAVDPGALVSGSNTKTPLVFAVSPKNGTLLMSDLQSGVCRDVILGSQSRDDRYGEAVESGGLVFVPDYVAGTVIIVDSRTGVILGHPRVDSPGANFVLLGYHSFVWFDDTHADIAGIVTLQGAIGVSTSRGSADGKKVGPGERGRTAGNSPAVGNRPPPPGPSVSSPPTATGPTVAGPPVAVPPAGPPPPPSTPTVPPPAGGAPPGSGPPVSTPPPSTPPVSTPPVTTPPSTSTTTALPAPSFTYTPKPGVVSDPVSFTDTTPGPHTVTGWTFATGYPATSTARNQTVKWSSPGTYTVTLTIKRSGGAASISQQVQIVPPANVVVPDVTGLTLAAATLKLQQASLAVGTQTTVDSFVARNAVASTTPATGSSVPKGSAINLNISDETGPISTYFNTVATPARSSIDGSGNLFVASYSKNEVFELESFSDGGKLTTRVAGNGTKGHTGDGGAATSAELNGPIATAVDPAGNVYIAEAPCTCAQAGSIRKVAPNGTITTLTNGILSPYGLTFFNSALYVVGRYGNCTVDRVDTTTGALTTVVGVPGTCTDGPTTLSDPASVTFDSSGAMYISEPHAEIIRKFQGGSLTTIAGTGTPGYSGDGGPATSAELHDPDDVAFDTSGDLFFTDWSNQVVREITPDGTIQTIAGTGTAGYTGDGGPANQAALHIGGNGSFSGGIVIDGAGHLFVSDTNNNAIREIT